MWQWLIAFWAASGIPVLAIPGSITTALESSRITLAVSTAAVTSSILESSRITLAVSTAAVTSSIASATVGVTVAGAAITES